MNYRPPADPTGDKRGALMVRLEYGLLPFERLAEQNRLRLGAQPGCECGHPAQSHYDHEGHRWCACTSYMPDQGARLVERYARRGTGHCACGHRASSHRGTGCLVTQPGDCRCSGYKEVLIWERRSPRSSRRA